MRFCDGMPSNYVKSDMIDTGTQPCRLFLLAVDMCRTTVRGMRGHLCKDG